MENKLKLHVEDLTVSFRTNQGMVRAVRGIDFDLYEGETLAIVGESGSGKSVSSRTIMGILAANGVIDKGQIIYEGQDLTEVDEEHFHEVRGNKIGMIFQDPMSSLNPIMRIGRQITEGMILNGKRLKNKTKKLYQLEKNNYTEIKHKIEKLHRVYKHNLALIEDCLYNENLQSLLEKQNSLEQQLEIAKSNPEAKAGIKQELNGIKKQIKSIQSDLKSKLAVEHKKNVSEQKVKLPPLKAEMIKAKRKAEAQIKQEWIAKKKEYQEKIQKVKENPESQAKLDEEIKVKEAELDVLNNQMNELIENFQEAFSKSVRDKDKIILRARFRENKKDLKFDIKEKQREIKALQNYTATKIRELKEELRRFKKVTNLEAKEHAIKIMSEVGIPQPEKRFKQYPFQFSGGMRQRIVIAIALTANPDILICDEPTTALDVTIQAQILELINNLKKERNLSVIFITHDLGVVANMADRIAVMYAGKIVEIGTVEEIFYQPKHPYTWALLSSMPDIMSKERLTAIPGTPPNMLFPPKGDAFAERNQYAMKIDFEIEPPMFKITDTHYAATWLLHKDAPKVEMPEVVKNRIERMLKTTEGVTKNG